MADDKQSGEGLRLREIVDEIFNLYDYLEKSNEPTNSGTIQSRVKDGVSSCKRAIVMVNGLQLFSNNEDMDDVATSEIRYMLLSAYLAYFTLKNTSDDRMESLHQGEQHFKDFLRLCKSYSVCDRLIPSQEETEDSPTEDNSAKSIRPADLNAMTRDREAKIKQFKEKREIEQKLAELSEAVNRSHVEDEVQREYYLMLLTHWVHRSLEELNSIKDEVPILEHMRKMRLSDGAGKQEATKASKKPFRPFILTKSDLQKQVFGLGYPGVPTMTVDEFYEKKVADGTFNLPGESMQDWAKNPEETAARIEEEDVEKEELIQRDDPVTIIRERNWDEWKDDHRRGWGNRQNMG